VTGGRPDVARIVAAQALRAAGYGFTAVLLGAGLAARGWSPGAVGALLAAVVAGTALASLTVAACAERVGRRRCYLLLYALLAVTGTVFALADRPWALVAVALTGTLSTEVIESGPFTSLEQAMLAQATAADRAPRTFARYNAVAALAGSLGALAAGGSGPAGSLLGLGIAPTDPRWFGILAVAGLGGAALAAGLSGRVETPPGEATRPARPLARSQGSVIRLAGLFAVDAFGGGFVVQSYLAYWFGTRYGLPLETLGLLFAAVGLLQTASFLAAGRLGERFGLLPTMVFTHLPSNLLLAAVAFAPTAPVAVALLLGRSALSQMDVPTRQAYVMALVDPAERPAAAALTNTARLLVRPLGPALAGAAQTLGAGAPLVLAGAVKAAYDLALWHWFRRVPLTRPPDPTTADPAPQHSGT